MNLCDDCKHMAYGLAYRMCMAPHCGEAILEPCWIQRRVKQAPCGPEGRLWEPKQKQAEVA